MATEYPYAYWTTLQTLMRHMVQESGMRATAISRSMGRTSGYLSTLLSDGRTPRLDLFISIAQACGYSVQVNGHGETIVLTNRNFIGADADDYPDTQVFAIASYELENQLPREDEPPEATKEPTRKPVVPIDFSSIEEESEEEFAARDPEGYQEYRREMDEQFLREMGIQEQFESLMVDVRDSMIEAIRRNASGD